MTEPVNNEIHSDIKADDWVLRLPAKLQPYARLMRLDRPIGTWLLLLPGWWAIILASDGMGNRFISLRDMLAAMALFALGAVVMRGAGCIVNDLWDRNLDRKVARTAIRPLASGQIRPVQALLLLAVLLAIGCWVLMQLSYTAIFVGLISIPFIVMYPLMKRITWWPQAFLGLTFNFGALVGWAAMTDTIALPAIFLYVAGFFWTLGYDTIYAHQDIADDAAAGIKSTARRLGEKNKLFVGSSYAICWVLLVGAFAAAGAPSLCFFILVVCALHLAWQALVWRTDNPASALQMFKSNRDFGLMVTVAALLS